MSVLDTGSSTAVLGVDDKALLTLHEDATASPASRTNGLYHFAILVPTRLDLARSIRRLIDTHTSLQGFADHWVSEAVYLADPDGNGIEIYRDRPRSQWPRENGQLLMATDPLDVKSLLAELDGESEAWTGLTAGTTIGHIHLQVSGITQAVDFYRDVLGFDLVLLFGPSAAFLSAGGYHHHIGCNTWAGRGIPVAPPDALGLLWFAIELPDHVALEGTLRRLESHKAAVEEREEGLFLRDPFGIGILLRAPAPQDG